MESDKVTLLNEPDSQIPPPPKNHEQIAGYDILKWYEFHYAGWNVEKKKMPSPPPDGAKGKKVIVLLPGLHPYWVTYSTGVKKVAADNDVRIEILYGYLNDPDEQDELVTRAIQNKPDCIILAPGDARRGNLWYKKMYDCRIPVIGSNLLPNPEAFSDMIAWTGPDDWAQQAMLVRKFAGFMQNKGGYAIINHHPGSSAYSDRTYSTIGEINAVAPEMELLSMAYTEFDVDATFEAVEAWILEYGDRLKGIVTADDNLCLDGIIRAINKHNRHDIICVANGVTPFGLNALQCKSLKAMTFQPPEIDGRLAIQTAIDWLNGLIVAPLHYLPSKLITEENAGNYIHLSEKHEELDVHQLCDAIAALDYNSVESFFTKLHRQLVSEEVVTLEYFRGLTIKIIAELLGLMKHYGIDEKSVFGDYETLFKNLFRQKTILRTIEWLKQISSLIITFIKLSSLTPKSLGTQLKEYVTAHSFESISLKTISYDFNMSATYLGQVFKKEVGKVFSVYLNERRINHAKELLVKGAHSAKEVAGTVGYADPNYFYTIFKKYAGMYPSEFISKLHKPE